MFGSSPSPSVERGDVVRPDIPTDDKHVVKVEWTQSFKSKNAEYYQGTYKNETKPDQNSLIFVQKSKMEEFKRLLNDGKVTIDSKFQYGQKDKTGRDRWIVFHDKDQKMFQHRFVMGVAMKAGNNVGDVLAKMGGKAGEGVQELMRTLAGQFGQNLHDF